MSRIFAAARAISASIAPVSSLQSGRCLQKFSTSTAICSERRPQFLSIQSRKFSAAPAAFKEKVHITFVETDGTRKEVEAEVGQSILDAAHEHDIDLEGACEGTLACSTCHVIVDDSEFFGKLPPPEEEEMDMLDLAIGLEDNSRLGCQIVLNKGLEGMVLRLPADTVDRRGRAE